jgi:flagellar capping protein FliD
VFLDRLGSDFDDVRDFFLAESSGLGDRLTGLVDSFTDPFEGQITNRADTIDRNVDELDRRIVALEDRLDGRRLRLLKEFAALENTLSLLQSQLDALNRFQSIKPLSFQGGSNSN